MVSTVKEYKEKRAKMIDYLGGKCVNCGIIENLRIDHKDHTIKNFDISAKWGLEWEKLKTELDLCQLLCSSCHKSKTLKEGSLKKGWTTQPRGLVHGTSWGYIKYKCRCDECKKAKSLTYKSTTRNVI